MFSYSWETDYANVCAVFDDGWKRFNKCNAAVFETKHTQTFGEGTCVNVERSYFVSYATPIAMVKREYNIATGHRNYTHIYINMSMWDISRTTKRQLREFINRLSFFNDIGFDSLQLFRELSTHEHTSKYDWYIGNRCHVIPMTPHEMDNIFDTQCPYYG